MEIKTDKGKKNEYGNDRPILIKTEGWERVTNEDILYLIKLIFENEDVIYPRPQFLGAGMFLNEILKIYAERINSKNASLERYITKKPSPKILADFL